MSFLPSPPHYANFPGNADRVYDAICKTLSDRQDAVDWTAFTEQDWQLMQEMVKYEGVGPLLYWHFKDAR
ncbi:MAG: hypothetical protein GY792_08340, partial [Gammaproteobacteria bacterium]|nr:hypothetical protein [Gammaproteobacteria bacterium]